MLRLILSYLCFALCNYWLGERGGGSAPLSPFRGNTAPHSHCCTFTAPHSHCCTCTAPHSHCCTFTAPHSHCCTCTAPHSHCCTLTAPHSHCCTCTAPHCRYGQLSGMVEPLAGLFGTVAVVVSARVYYRSNTASFAMYISLALHTGSHYKPTLLCMY